LYNKVVHLPFKRWKIWLENGLTIFIAANTISTTTAAPTQHRKSLNGRREIKISLGTRDNRSAADEVHCLNVQFEHFLCHWRRKVWQNYQTI